MALARVTNERALEVFLNDMRYINPRFTYLLTYASCNWVDLLSSVQFSSMCCERAYNVTRTLQSDLGSI